MKLHSFIFKILIFSVVLIFFVLPPVFFSNKTDFIFEKWSFPLVQLNLFLFSAFLFKVFGEYKSAWLEHKYDVFYKLIFPATFSFCLLFCISLFTEGISCFFKMNEPLKIVKPDSVKTWSYCVLNFIFAAFYEEAIYRFFLPEVLLDFTSKLNKRFIPYILEAIVCFSFAFAHFEYGIFSVINALFAHMVLRIVFKRTRQIYAGTLAHFLYNLLQIILL